MRGEAIEDLVVRFIVQDENIKKRYEEIRIYHCMVHKQADEYQHRQQQMAKQYKRSTKNLNNQLRKMKNQMKVLREESRRHNVKSGAASQQHYWSATSENGYRYHTDGRRRESSSITHLSPTDSGSDTDVKQIPEYQWSDDRSQSHSELPRANQEMETFGKRSSLSVTKVEENQKQYMTLWGHQHPIMRDWPQHR